MAADPSGESISQMIEFSGCDTETARRYLKAKNNDVAAAISALMEGEDISGAENAMKWSEGDFSADRDGNVPFGPSQASFDNDNQYIHPLGAPTRGSSPVPSLKQPETMDQEDAEMRRAIAMSCEDATFGQQETGVLSGNKAASHFGPATQRNYDMAKWGVVTTTQKAVPGQEIIPDLEPQDRVNKDGEPRCLRPLPTREYLPNLLTVLHAIPLSRKALLMPHKSRTSYGQDPEWWKGHPIRLPRIVSTVDLSAAEPAITGSDELVAEMQRIMALLDSSSRSYGSADALVSLEAVQHINSEPPTDSIVDKVLQAWELSAKKVAPDHAADAEIFRSVMGTNDEDGVMTPYMRLMPLTIGIEHADRDVTLNEALNELLWDLDDPEDSDYYIEKPAEILSIHATREDKSAERARLVIPPSFHIDQYLKENVGETRALRADIAQAKQRITNIESAQLKLQSLDRGEPKGRIDAVLLVDHALGHFSGQNKQAMLDERLASGADADVELPPPSEQHEHMVGRLQAFYASIKTKIEILNEESRKTKELLSRLWQSTSDSIPSDSLKHRYWLRGVATKPNVTYVLLPRDGTAAVRDAILDDDEAPEGMQWWRIEYDEDGTKISKTLSTQDDVIRAAELEHKEAFIVYASDAAIALQQEEGLPRSLREFIRNDDEAFNEELQFVATTGIGNLNVLPLERERRTSIDSTMVNFGDDADPPSYDQPAHEITLDGVEPDEDDDDDAGLEMAEKPHGPLGQMLTQQKGSDTAMIDIGQSRERGNARPDEESQDLVDMKESI